MTPDEITRFTHDLLDLFIDQQVQEVQTELGKLSTAQRQSVEHLAKIRYYTWLNAHRTRTTHRTQP